MNIVLFFASIFFLFSVNSKASNSIEKTANIILLCGQSNATGVAEIKDVTQSNFTSLDTVKYACAGESNLQFTAGITMTMKAYLNSGIKCHGLELGLGENLHTSGMSDVFIVKYAWGGSWIDLWQKNSTTIFEGKSNLYNNALAFLNSKINEVKALGYTKLTFKGLVWLQGESDGTQTGRANVYGDKLNNTMLNFERDIASTFQIQPSEVPIFLVQPASYQDKTKYQLPDDEAKVTTALSNHALQNQNARFIPTSDLTGYIDNMIHFNTVSQLEIGSRVSNLMVSFVISPTTPYFVRPDGDSNSWTNLVGIDPTQIITSSTPTLLSSKTYYFAKGTYTKSAIVLTTGKLYGGFKGDETTINLANRALSDKDNNGIIEPWEFTDETIITGTNPISGAYSTNKLITVTGGEVNGLTFQDHYSNNNGVIVLGSVATLPTADMDIIGNAGKMIHCTIKKIKSTSTSPIMTTNQYSLMDGCLIEECIGASGTGATGAVYMNSLGGKIFNSVLRNNSAPAIGAYSGAIRASALSGTDMNAIVQNCAIYNNTSGGGGGAIRCDTQAGKRGIQLVNCTVVNNKTTTANTSSVDLIAGGLLVNSIVVNDPQNEIRPNNVNNYISSNAYGTLLLATGITAYPNTNMVSGKTAADFNFNSVHLYAGSMEPSAVDFNQATYDAIRASNFSITSASSVACTTTSLSTIPSSYTVGGLGVTTVNLTAMVPETDIIGVSRPLSTLGHISLGAYQYNPLINLPFDRNHSVSIYSTKEGIIINGAEARMVTVYSISGQLLQSIKPKSDVYPIRMNKGFYVVTVGLEKIKVLV